jgi:Cu/Ag efflux pump CusA
LTLEAIANDLVDIIGEVDYVVEPSNGIEQGMDQIKLTVNNEAAMVYGLTNEDVLNSLTYLYSNLEGLTGSQTVSVQIEGVDYDIDIPSNSLGNVDFSMFGDYLTFLSGVQLFDQETQMMIDEYVKNNELDMMAGNTVYILNAALPTYQFGDPMVFVLNPFLKINNDGEIVFAPADFSLDTLQSKALAPLYTSDSSSVTSIEKVTGFAAINTDGNQRYLNVTAQIEEGHNVTIVSNEVNDKVRDYINSDFKAYGSGYTITLQGENEEIMDAIGDLSLAGLVAILLVYMIMAIQFQSLKYPFIILMTIPLAFTGGFLALLITGLNLSMVAMMGLIILVGVVVNNGIVLIDYMNKLVNRGYTIKDAIIKAGKTRLRPIFMTALTTILALIMTAIGVGEGAELLQPMAITAIGGLTYATILTLIVVPTVFALFNRKKMKKESVEDGVNER